MTDSIDTDDTLTLAVVANAHRCKTIKLVSVPCADAVPAPNDIVKYTCASETGEEVGDCDGVLPIDNEGVRVLDVVRVEVDVEIDENVAALALPDETLLTEGADDTDVFGLSDENGLNDDFTENVFESVFVCDELVEIFADVLADVEPVIDIDLSGEKEEEEDNVSDNVPKSEFVTIVVFEADEVIVPLPLPLTEIVAEIEVETELLGEIEILLEERAEIETDFEGFPLPEGDERPDVVIVTNSGVPVA